MKLAITLTMLLLISSIGTAKSQSLNMPGAYRMKSVSIKSGQFDTSFSNISQLKIYTDNYMMYANINSPDSVSSFGIGSYVAGKDSLTEHVVYNANDSVEHSQPATFQLAIKKTGKGYSQFIAGMQNDNGQKFDLTEVYESVGSSTKTPLDGAWKMVKAYFITGSDTTPTIATQYKTYYAGRCIWGHTWKDAANKIHTGIGFGKFSMPSAKKVKESMTASTYAEVRDHSFDIDIDMMGKDGFKQTLKTVDGSKLVEFYQRLK